LSLSVYLCLYVRARRRSRIFGSEIFNKFIEDYHHEK